MKKTGGILLIWSILTLGLFAQETGQTGNLIKGGVADGNKLVDAYTRPLNKALIFSLGQMDYTGFVRNHGRRFSVGLQTVYLMAPRSERTYNLNDLNLETLEPEDPDNAEAATILGDSLLQNTLVSKKKDLFGRPLIKFKTPGGSGYAGFPLPALNLSYRTTAWSAHFGLIPLLPVPTTDLKIFMLRGAFDFNLASKLDFIDAGKSAWDVGVAYGYFHGFSHLDVRPDGVITLFNPTGNHNGPYDYQRLLIDYHSFSASTHYARFLGKHWQVFAGLNAVFGTSSLQLKGKYPVYLTDPMGGVSITATDVEDPLDIQNSYGGIFVQTGLRADWKHWALLVQANLANYSGLSFRLSYKLW